MGKLADLASIKSAKLDNFVYMPPDQAMSAARILVLANLGYALGSPSALNWGTLSAVLRGLRRASPRARIMLVDKICPASSAESIFARIGLNEAIDEEMRAVPTDNLLKRDYPNPLPEPLHHALFIAPEALSDFDCVVNVAVFEARNNTVQASVNALYHFLPCEFPVQTPNSPQRHHDIYFSLASYVDAVVLEVPVARDDIRVLWGEDLLALDETACQITNAPVPDYIGAIRVTRKAMLS